VETAGAKEKEKYEFRESGPLTEDNAANAQNIMV